MKWQALADQVNATHIGIAGAAAWYDDDRIHLYWRYAKSWMGYSRMFTIATVEVREDLRRTGVLSSLVTEIMSGGLQLAAGVDHLRIENAGPSMISFAKKHGMQFLRGHEGISEDWIIRRAA